MNLRLFTSGGQIEKYLDRKENQTVHMMQTAWVGILVSIGQKKFTFVV